MSTDGGALGYAELLRLATTNGLQELDCSIIQVPHDGNGNHAIVLATARTTRGLFRSIGEARQASVSVSYQEMTLTVAEQRAKIRVLSEAVGMPRVLRVDKDPGTVEAPNVEEPQSHAVAAATLPPANTSSVLRSEPRADENGPTVRHVGAPASALRGAQDVVATTGAAPMLSPDRGPATLTDARKPGQKDAQPSKAANAVTFSEDLGPDVLARLMDMTRRKAQAEGTVITEEEAARRLDSFFQRAFGHPLSEGTRMEGQRVVQRLASDLARLGAENAHAATARS